MRRIPAACIAGALLAAFVVARAQADPAQAPHVPDHSGCPPANGTTRGSPGENTGSGTLSDRLSESKGVICPPAGVDPGMAAPPPGGGRMPVIPPPGTPGGDPGLQPK